MIQADLLGFKFRGGTAPLFQNVNLKVNQGETVAVMGASGSGKSTLLKILGGLLPASEGSVSVAADRLGYLFQNNALFDSMTCLENLTFPMREVLKQKELDLKVRAQALLASVGLEAAASLFPSEISGGMQKRLGLARALCVEPEVLLFDEPTAGLDPVTSRQIGMLLLDLAKQRGCASLVVTSDFHRARQFGDRVYILDNETLYEVGTGADLHQSKHPSVRKLLNVKI